MPKIPLFVEEGDIVLLADGTICIIYKKSIILDRLVVKILSNNCCKNSTNIYVARLNRIMFLNDDCECAISPRMVLAIFGCITILDYNKLIEQDTKFIYAYSDAGCTSNCGYLGYTIKRNYEEIQYGTSKIDNFVDTNNCELLAFVELISALRKNNVYTEKRIIIIVDNSYVYQLAKSIIDRDKARTKKIRERLKYNNKSVDIHILDLVVQTLNNFLSIRKEVSIRQVISKNNYAHSAVKIAMTAT